jgi:hypothetical protein
MKIHVIAKVAAKKRGPEVFEVGDIVSQPGTKVQYEVLEVKPDGKLRLKPIEGGLGEFTMPSGTLRVVTPKTPKVTPADVWAKKVVERVEKHIGDTDGSPDEWDTLILDALIDLKVPKELSTAVQKAVRKIFKV